MGPSPRGRGNHSNLADHKSSHRAIPARAGEPGQRSSSAGSSRGHPRAGGGTPIWLADHPFAEGPSPRGRGNPLGGIAASRRTGAIPARAGEPQEWLRRSLFLRGHPRAGGGTVADDDPRLTVTGPSPRGRGNLVEGVQVTADEGAIPARAGEPSARRRPCAPSRGHPRAGGGTSAVTTLPAEIRGPSPRGGGTWVWKPLTSFCRGPSPRGRGNLPLDREWLTLAGAIPARAGEPEGLGPA